MRNLTLGSGLQRDESTPLAADIGADQESGVLTAEGRMASLTQVDLFLASSVFTYAREGILVLSAQHVIVDINESFTRLTDRTRSSVIGKEVHSAFPVFLESIDTEHIWNELARRGFWQGELRSDISAQTGQIYSMHVRAIGGLGGQPAYYLCFLTDIGRFERREQRLRSLAETDALTGVANRSLFLYAVNEAIERAKTGGVQPSILFLDLDGFKEVNDKLGHGQGDELLRDVAQVLQECVRTHDMVARLGGDEFVVLLSGANRAALSDTAQRIVQRLEFSLGGEAGQQVSVTCSVGIASFPGDGSDVLELLKNADKAMYAVKAHGKRGFRFATAEPGTSI